MTDIHFVRADQPTYRTDCSFMLRPTCCCGRQCGLFWREFRRGPGFLARDACWRGRRRIAGGRTTASIKKMPFSNKHVLENFYESKEAKISYPKLSNSKLQEHKGTIKDTGTEPPLLRKIEKIGEILRWEFFASCIERTSKT